MLEQATGMTCGSKERAAHAGAGLVAGLVTPWKGPPLGQFVKNCSSWEGLRLEQFMENCLPWEGPQAGAGAECDTSSPEEEEVAGTTCEELTAAPVPPPP